MRTAAGIGPTPAAKALIGPVPKAPGPAGAQASIARPRSIHENPPASSTSPRPGSICARPLAPPSCPRWPSCSSTRTRRAQLHWLRAAAPRRSPSHFTAGPARSHHQHPPRPSPDLGSSSFSQMAVSPSCGAPMSRAAADAHPGWLHALRHHRGLGPGARGKSMVDVASQPHRPASDGRHAPAALATHLHA